MKRSLLMTFGAIVGLVTGNSVALAEVPTAVVRSTTPTVGKTLPATRPVGSAEIRYGGKVVAGTRTEKKDPPLILFKAPAAQLKWINLANMNGWTQVSNASTLGGASLFEIEGATYLVTTALDNEVYLAPFNPVAPKLIPSSTWQNVANRKLYSEPKCVAGKLTNQTDGQFTLLCVSLGQKGNAQVLSILHEGGGFGYPKEPEDIGGQGAQMVPVITNLPQPGQELPSKDFAYFDQKLVFGVAVWGGANGKLFANEITTGVVAQEGFAWSAWGTKKPDKWPTLPGTFIGAPGCSATRWTTCVVAGPDGTVRVFDVLAGYSLPNIEFKKAASTPAPAGLSGEVALTYTNGGRYIVLARGKDGQAYQTVYKGGKFSAWKPEGGYVMANTQPTCVAVNETATCVIQGLDGKLYSRQLSPAGAM